MYTNYHGDPKFRAIGTYRALDGTIFKDVDTQNPSTEVLLGGLTARMVQDSSDGPQLLQKAYEAILFEPEKDLFDSLEATAATPPPPPTQYIVYFSPVDTHNKLTVRCGKIDYADAPIPADKVAQTSAAAKVEQSSDASSSSAASSSPVLADALASTSAAAKVEQTSEASSTSGASANSAKGKAKAPK